MFILWLQLARIGICAWTTGPTIEGSTHLARYVTIRSSSNANPTFGWISDLSHSSWIRLHFNAGVGVRKIELLGFTCETGTGRRVSPCRVSATSLGRSAVVTFGEKVLLDFRKTVYGGIFIQFTAPSNAFFCFIRMTGLIVVDCVWGPWSSAPCSSQCGEGVSQHTRYVKTFPRNGGRVCPGTATQTRLCKVAECSRYVPISDNAITATTKAISQGWITTSVKIELPATIWCRSLRIMHTAFQRNESASDNFWFAGSSNAQNAVTSSSKDYIQLDFYPAVKDQVMCLDFGSTSAGLFLVDAIYFLPVEYVPMPLGTRLFDSGETSFQTIDDVRMDTRIFSLVSSSGLSDQLRIQFPEGTTTQSLQLLYERPLWPYTTSARSSGQDAVVTWHSSVTQYIANGAHRRSNWMQLDFSLPVGRYPVDIFFTASKTTQVKVVDISILQNVDCTFDTWSGWTACSVTCGLGQRSRSRAVMAHATSVGNECDESRESASCVEALCLPVDCSWTLWAEWSTCSLAFGVGTKWRSRQKTPYDGQDCMGERGETAACEGIGNDAFIDLPKNSLKNSKTRYDGAQSLAWLKLTLPQGFFCRCIRVKGLKFYPQLLWSQDTFQVAAESGGQYASVTQYANYNDLEFLPVVTGDIQIHLIATVDGTFSLHSISVLQSVNCVWNDWSMLSSCSASCGYGVRERTRSVKVQAQFGGDSCEGKPREVTKCFLRPCDSTPLLLDATVRMNRFTTYSNITISSWGRFASLHLTYPGWASCIILDDMAYRPYLLNSSRQYTVTAVSHGQHAMVEGTNFFFSPDAGGVVDIDFTSEEKGRFMISAIRVVGSVPYPW